jgi:hypothetical protein
VALIICQNGRFFTYRSFNHKSWLLLIKEIVRLYHLDINIHINVEAVSLHTLSLTTCFLKDIERQLQSRIDQNSKCITDRE